MTIEEIKSIKQINKRITEKKRLNNNIKNSYTPQTGSYKVKPKHGDDWKKFDHVRLQISVGQQYHEGEKLKATIDWAVARFKTVTVCVNDTLQRNTISFTEKITPSLAVTKAKLAGDSWITRNQERLNHSSITIKRWDEWINHSDYRDIYQELDHVYRTNNRFSSALKENINDFWQRRSDIDSATYSRERYPTFYEASRDYLLEEGAAFILMSKIKKGIDVYPGTILKCFTEMKQDIKHGELFERNFLRIDFSKNKNAA